MPIDDPANESFASRGPAPWLTHFAVVGLHFRQNIYLKFAGRHTIFIADNGAGKTTALYILQSILTNDWLKLPRFNFDHLEIGFNDGNIFRVSRRSISEIPWLSTFRRLSGRSGVSEKQIRYFMDLTRINSLSTLRDIPEFRSMAAQMKLPTAQLYDRLLRYSTQIPNNDELFSEHSSEVEAVRSYLHNNFEYGVIYLPTYRRIEQELKIITDQDWEEENALSNAIQFGMKDVEHRIDKVGKSIRDHFAVAYASTSGQMLHQLTRTTVLSQEMTERLSERENIETILTRLSNFIDADDRQHILSLFDTNRLLSNQHLSFFLYNLIAAYDEVSFTEMSIQDFVRVCNSYFLEKEFRYNPSNAQLRLFSAGSKDELPLNALSSGEKQVLGVMSQIYLGADKNYIVIFDEPELSLSVEWQRKILVDIALAPRCWSLISATHSPFVFQNELDSFACSLQSTRYSLPAQGDA